MAIEEQTARTVFKGDGSTRAFPVTWYLDAEENVIVKMTNVTTAQVKTLELGTDYTVTPSDDEYPTNGAVINYPKNSVTPALGSDYRLTVIRNVPYTQSFVFPNNTRLLPKNIEGGLDGLELQIQQVNDKADQSLRIPDGLDIDGEEFVSSLYDASESAKNSAEEAKETLEATKKQAQIIETTKNEAVADINDYTEQSYLNAKSVNIRQFKNIETMKEATNITDDLLIATQGFNTAGDGGNAQYYVMPEDSEEEADGYSVIDVRERISGAKVGSAKVGNARTTKYKNRKIGLLTPNFVDVRWFGAVLDGITDDSDAFNRAVKFLANKRKKFTFNDITNVASGTLYVPKGIMKINKAIEIDAGCMGAYFDGTIIDATEISTDYAVRLYSSTWSHLSSTAMHNLFGLILRGDKTKNKVAILYDGVPQFNMVKSAVSGFGKSIQFKNNCYIYNFYDCGFDRCSDVCIENPSGLSNAGERVNFIGCTFANSTLAIRNANPNGAIHLLNCSIDYNMQAFDISNNAIIFCTDCHFEWAKYDKPHFVLNGNSSMLKINGGYMVSRPEVDYEEVPKLNCTFDNQSCNCTGGVILDNVHMHHIITDYLFSGVNYQIKNSKTYYPFELPPLCEQDIDYSKFSDCLDTFIQKANDSTQVYIDGTNVAVKRINYSNETMFRFFKKINPDSSGFGNLVLEFMTNNTAGGAINVSLNTAYEKNDGTIQKMTQLDYYDIKNLVTQAGANNKVKHTHTCYVGDNLLLFGKNYNKNIYIYVNITLWGLVDNIVFKFNKINFEQF